jgi:hypothetical protein
MPSQTYDARSCALCLVPVRNSRNWASVSELAHVAPSNVEGHSRTLAQASIQDPGDRVWAPRASPFRAAALGLRDLHVELVHGR